jgi:hypothetical protein
MVGPSPRALHGAAVGVAALSVTAAAMFLALPFRTILRPAAKMVAPPQFVALGHVGDCSAGKPCGSLAQALRQARPGSTVKIAAGRYPEQVLAADARPAGSAAVTLEALPGAKVIFAGVRCGASAGDRGPDALRIVGMRFDNVLINRCDRLSLHGVEIHGGLFLEGATRFSMFGGSVGPGTDFHPDIKAVYQSHPPIVPRRILFDGVRFHDWKVVTPGEHIECLQVSDVDGLIVRRSRFERCDTFDLHIQGTEAGPVKDVVIEDNEFGTTGDHSNSIPAYYSLSVRDGIGVRIARNRSTQGWALPAAGATVQDWTVSHNAAPMRSWQCDRRVAYRHNRWTGASCGPTDLPAAPLP